MTHSIDFTARPAEGASRLLRALFAALRARAERARRDAAARRTRRISNCSTPISRTTSGFGRASWIGPWRAGPDAGPAAGLVSSPPRPPASP